MVIEKEVVLVNSKELENVFLELENRSVIPFIYVTLRTTENLSEIVLKSKVDGTKNPYWKQIVKQSKKCYRLVVDYKKRVENNLLKEGKSLDEYIQGSLSGKKHLSKCILTDKTDTERYVMLEYFENSPIKGETKYFVNNNEIDKTLLSKWIVYRENNPKNQGLEKTVHPITPKIDNIVELRVDGKIYLRKE